MSELFGLFLLLLMVLGMLVMFQMQDHKMRRLELEERGKLLAKYLDVLEDNKRLNEALEELKWDFEQYKVEEMRNLSDDLKPSRNQR